MCVCGLDGILKWIDWWISLKKTVRKWCVCVCFLVYIHFLGYVCLLGYTCIFRIRIFLVYIYTFFGVYMFFRIYTGCPKKKWPIAIPHITLLKMVRFSKFFFSWPRFRSEVPRGNDIFLIKLEFHQKNWLQTNLLQN